MIAGAYRLDGILVRGAHHMLVAATHAQLGARVVLELAWPTRVDRTTVQRFLRDARAASGLHTRHTARVLDAGALDDGGFYLASEHVAGEDLRAALAHRGCVGAHEAASWLVPVCEAIAEAHEAGIVHRELELEGVVVTPAGVKVTGLARMTALVRVPYADPRTDIFAIGRMLFELVTGHSPLVAGVASLRARTYLPQGFISILERCLAPDAARRYQRAGDLAAALAVFAAPQLHREAPPFTAANVVAVEADRG